MLKNRVFLSRVKISLSAIFNFSQSHEVIKQLFCMHSQSCELQLTCYKETPLLLHLSFYFLTNYFEDTHCLMNKRSDSSVIYLSPIVSFSKYFCQNMPFKADNWHALSHEQCFWKRDF